MNLKSFGTGNKTALNLAHTQKTLFFFAAYFTHGCYLPLSAATEVCVPIFRLIQLTLRGPFLIPDSSSNLTASRFSYRKRILKHPIQQLA